LRFDYNAHDIFLIDS